MASRKKLKVFKVPTGFHDAYVAAPSKKAALEAWGSDADLFARGIAELVTDEELSREPLEHPGKVIKRLRGTAEEQLAASAVDPPRLRAKEQEEAETEPFRKQRTKVQRRSTADAPPGLKVAPKLKPKPRPSREKLDAAEHALSELLERQHREEGALIDRQRALEQEQRKLTAANERERRAVERALEKERDLHSERLNRWINQQS